MKKTLITQIKPCPHCGGKARIAGTDNGREMTTARIVCTVCGCGTKTYNRTTKTEESPDEDALQQAVAVWNMRNGYGMKGGAE